MKLPVADIVYVSAGAAAPDPAWLHCLHTGGRLVMPWQPAPGEGRTLVVRRKPRGFSVRLHGQVSFVGCVGAEMRDVRLRGMPARPVAATHSLWLTSERAPDERATAIYEDVWFSADDV